MADVKRYDVMILGGGPGGYVAAIRGAQLGLSVALIEKEGVGGTCLHHGCIPSKAIIRNAEVLSLMRRSEEFGIKIDNLQPDFGQAVDRSQKVIQRLKDGLAHLLKKNKVDVFSGTGKFVSQNQIEVAGSGGKTIIEGTWTIVATGSRVRRLANLISEGPKVFTSDEALVCRELPRSIAIIGGGAVGVELAYVYSVYGVKVAIIEMAPSLLPLEDKEVSSLLTRSFKKRGIEVVSNACLDAIKEGQSGFFIHLRGEGEPRHAEAILVAIGRMPNVEGIGLEGIGVALNGQSRCIEVDARMRTNLPTLFALGDVTTRPALAHGAMAQGIFIAESIAGMDRPPVDLLSIPNAVYCQPQVASLGLTEEAARREGHAIKVVKYPFMANGKAIAMGEAEGFVKVVADEACGAILGAHIIGPEATELIGEFVLAKTFDMTSLQLKRAIHPHPTLSEVVMEAGGAVFGEAIHF